MIDNFLAKALCPVTIIAKVIKKSDGDDFLSVMTIVFWVIGVLISWVVVPATATLAFQIISLIVGYFLAHLFYSKVDTYQTNSDFLEFIFMISIGFIGGYTFGLMMYFFFLLY